ncbi:MAG: potassium channel family protein [Myxococcota bacterium]
MSLVVVGVLSTIGIVAIHHVALTFMIVRPGFLPDLGPHAIGAVVSVAMLAHLVEIGCLACCWHALLRLEVVELAPNAVDFADTLYFVGVVYTSVGFGDVVPVGAARHLATVHAVAGLVLVAWTASYTYLEAVRVSNLVSGSEVGDSAVDRQGSRA